MTFDLWPADSKFELDLYFGVIYLHIENIQNPSKIFEVIVRKPIRGTDGRKDGRTDGQVQRIMPPPDFVCGGIKTQKVWNNLKWLKRWAFQCIRGLKIGFCEEQKVWNQIKIWTLTSLRRKVYKQRTEVSTISYRTPTYSTAASDLCPKTFVQDTCSIGKKEERGEEMPHSPTAKSVPQTPQTPPPTQPRETHGPLRQVKDRQIESDTGCFIEEKEKRREEYATPTCKWIYPWTPNGICHTHLQMNLSLNPQWLELLVIPKRHLKHPFHWGDKEITDKYSHTDHMCRHHLEVETHGEHWSLGTPVAMFGQNSDRDIVMIHPKPGEINHQPRVACGAA